VNPQLAVFASSLVGAVLFFLGGFYFARSAAPARQPAVPAGRASAAASGGAAPPAIEPKPAADSRIMQLELGVLREEFAKCRGRLAQVEQERVPALEEEIRRQREQTARLEAANAQLQQALRGKELEAVGLDEQRSDLKRRLEQSVEEAALLRDQARSLRKSEAAVNQLAIENESLNRQLAMLERYKEENTRLTAALAEEPELRSSMERLRQENRQLRSLGLVQQPPARVRPAPSEPAGESVQELLEQFARRMEVRGSALADEHGLLVAGTGPHAEGLAVASALADGLMTQLGELLPMAALRRLVVVDANAVTAALYPFQAGSVRLTLASLSVGQEPDRAEIDELIGRATRLIDRERGGIA
jgi:hypothetical protein